MHVARYWALTRLNLPPIFRIAVRRNTCCPPQGINTILNYLVFLTPFLGRNGVRPLEGIENLANFVVGLSK